MKKRATLLLLTGLTMAACGSSAEKINEAGNSAFAEENYTTAQEKYSQAMAEDPDLAAPIYNSANVQYKQEAYETAQQTMQLAMLKADTELTQRGYFNLGNTLYNTEDFQGAVEAYKEALRIDPQDLDAKYNLELTLTKLQEQQQEEQQNQEEDQPDQEEQEDPQGGQGEENQEENSQQSDEKQEEESGESRQEDSSQQAEQEQDSEQEPQDQSQQEGQQGEEQQDQAQPDGEESDEQEQTGQEDETESRPDPRQAGNGGNGEETEPQQIQPAGQPVQVDGLTEEQARQLLIAASQDTETLQEYLQQMYVFPYADIDQDW